MCVCVCVRSQQYDNGVWKETIHMPTSVAKVADCDTLPLHCSALRRDRNGSSTEEVHCQDIQEVHLAAAVL